jgi:apolipoprotein N-acyltransferase
LTVTLRALCSLAAGLAVALSLPPWGWWPLALAGIVAFELVLGVTPPARSRFGLAFAFAFAWMTTGMAWMWWLTAPGYLVASAVFALLHAVAALAAPPGRWRIVGRPLTHALVEALRFSWPFGGVPLASLGISQAASPLAIIARVGGVILLTWVVLQAGFALGALVRRASGADVRLAGAAIAVLAAVFLVASVAPRGHGTGVFVDVVAVQGGGEQGTRADDVASEIVTARHVEATRSIEPDNELDLVVWPENVVDVVEFATSDELQAVASEAARLGVPISVGITEDVPGEPDRFANAQVIVTPDGTVTSRYDKVRRVPFGEYVPLRGLLEALGAPVDQVPNDAVAGTDPAYLELPDGTRASVVISWEVFFGGRVRDGVREGAGVVLNPTNGASYTGTILQTQQVASSRLRAIETGRWVVQAAPTGFSAFVTPGGDVIDRTAVGERAVIRHRVELHDGETWYVRLGDRPFIAVSVVAVAATWFAAPRQRHPGDNRSALDEHGDRTVVHQ